MSPSQSTPRNPQLLDFYQAADYLGVTDHWMRRARHEGRIPFVKLGRLVRFRVADLDAYIEANYQSASE